MQIAGKAYATTVRVGKACAQSFADGATHAEVIDGLRYSLILAERNKEFGIPESALAAGAEPEVAS